MLELAQLRGEGRHSDAAEATRASQRKHLYYAFLSYSHQDEAIADWLHDELEQFKVPHKLVGRLAANGVVPNRLAPIFRDRYELAAADDLGTEIEAALAASRFLIVMCSPAAAKSRWTNAEIETFKRSHPEGCVLGAIIDGEPFASEIPGREEEECFPPALRQKFDRRGRPTGKRAEPLAADLRDRGDGRRVGFLKLVAGMLGIGLDELVQREQTRRQRRLAWIAAASLVGMAVASGLAVTALQSRDAARDQRREAEGLVAFMLGDLREKLEPIGRLDALDGVGSRVLNYYRRQDASELSDEALLQRSRALNLMAEVAYLRGNLTEAQALYQQAMAGSGEAVSRSPDDPKRLFDHAQNVFWLGELARARGQGDQAVVAYQEYKRLADRLLELEPDNLKWRMESLYGAENVGISLYNKRRFAEAAQQFRSALQRMAALAAVDPGNSTYQKELSTVLAWLADAERAQGRLDSAIALRRRQISTLERAIAGGATDVQLRQWLIPAHQGLGILLMWKGEADPGIEELRSAVREAEQLMPLEPANTFWKSLAAGARLELARNLLSLKRGDEAAQQTAAACAIVAAIRPADSVMPRRTACLTMRARLASQRGAHAEAVALGQQALASAQRVRSEDPLRDRYTIATIHRLIGDARHKLSDAEGARAAWSAALSTLPQNVAETPFEMDERATILERLGRADEARQIATRLNNIGYKQLG